MCRVLYRLLVSLARLAVRSGRSKDLKIIVLEAVNDAVHEDQDQPASRQVNDHGRVSGTHKHGLTLDAAAEALDAATSQISALERGLHHDRRLAERYQQHLAEIAA